MAIAINPFRKLLPELTPKSPLIPTEDFRGGLKGLDAEMVRLIRKAGATSNMIRKSLEEDVQISYDRWNLYGEIERCLAGDTKIWLLNGTTPTIQEMAENPEKFVGKYTFSINPKTLGLEPDKITAIKKTQMNAQLVRVYLDNGKYVSCTPEHRFMLRDGSYREAQYLQSGDSLMPLYVRGSQRGLEGYLLVYNPQTKTWPYVYQHVAKFLLGYKKGKNLVVHHKLDVENGTFDIQNNDPSMLELMDSKEHKSYHQKIAIREHNVEICTCGRCKAIRGERSGVNNPLYGKHPWNYGKTKETDPRLKQASEKIKNYYQTPEGKKHAKRSGGSRSAATLKAWETRRAKARLMECLLNHKVVKVEWLKEKQDVYDITTEKNHNFPLEIGVFCHNSLEHWFVGPAVILYANVASTFSYLQGCTVWVTSDSETYQQELTKLFDRIGIEEKILDWAHAIGAYGDLFVKINGSPGLGVVSVDDSLHPMNIGRVDYEGVLLGFYKCPQGQTSISNDKGENPEQLIPPWEYVHFRLLGARRKRPRYSDPGYTEMRQIHLITGADTRQVTTRYGTSLVTNALPAYKRLRLAEDSLLLARVTRGIIRYIWKLKVSADNAEAVSALVDQYATLITRARAIDTRPDATTPYDDKQSNLTCIEDLFVPIWGDMDLSQEKVGGEADIRWIVDIDSLRQQLAFSLACPLAIGGAYVKEATGSLGSEAISKLDIRFARNARTLQRALILGLARLCQIHLAYMGMDPDPRLFEIHMTETSTAEEESLRKSLESGMRTFVNFVKSLKAVAGRKLDGEKVWDYYNEKVLRLKDFKLRDFYKSSEVVQKEIEVQKAAVAAKAVAAPPEEAGKTPLFTSKKKKIGQVIQEVMVQRKLRPIGNLDLCSYLPTTSKAILENCFELPGAGGVSWIERRDQDTWNNLTKGMMVRIGEAKEEVKEAEPTLFG